jgi:hypothetical protein
MGRSIGSFGTEHPDDTNADPDTFDWFGSTVRLTTALNEVELIDFMDAARKINDQDIAAMAIIKDMFVMVIHPDDFTRFWAVAKEKRQGLEELVQLFMALLEAITDRPTQRPSDSSNGQPTTVASSQVDSSASELSGRPDLQIIHDDNRATLERARQAMLAG